jgi:hypothetical protein
MPDFNARVGALLTRLGMGGESFVQRITGCPNGCARPYMAELAFVGQVCPPLACLPLFCLYSLSFSPSPPLSLLLSVCLSVALSRPPSLPFFLPLLLSFHSPSFPHTLSRG